MIAKAGPGSHCVRFAVLLRNASLLWPSVVTYAASQFQNPCTEVRCSLSCVSRCSNLLIIRLSIFNDSSTSRTHDANAHSAVLALVLSPKGAESMI
jgi:hypothetical protein